MCKHALSDNDLVVIEFNPDRRMIAGVLPAARELVDAADMQAFTQGRAEQETIDAQAGVAREGIPEILPERIDPLLGMQQADASVQPMAMSSA